MRALVLPTHLDLSGSLGAKQNGATTIRLMDGVDAL